MSKLYDDVKKQGTQIDDLQKKVTDHGTRIETLETQAMATPPAQTSAVPSEVKVVLPDDIARKSDIDQAVTRIVWKCKVGESQPATPASVTVSPMSALEKAEYEKTTRQAVKAEIEDSRKIAKENNSMLRTITNRINRADNEGAMRRKLYVTIGGYVVYTILLIVTLVELHKQNTQIEHLKRVEWLYRWSRIYVKDTEEYQDFERRMLNGKKEEREGMKAKIFSMERDAPQFLYFKPVDDWMPEPPAPPKAEEKEQPSSQTASTSKPQHHKQGSQLTPAEIKAIKDMRANPHIPADAKPELPKGYE